jgi:DNA-binding MarR family transcriptional regulator
MPAVKKSNSGVESDPPRDIRLSEKDVSDALRLLKKLAGDEGGDLVRALSDARDRLDVTPRSFVPNQQSWVPLARSVFLSRRRRNQHFPAAMLGEPAWDMLLALFIFEQSEGRVTVTGLAEHSGAPLTTALRWIDYLENAGFLVRRPKPTDRRAVFIELSDKGRDRLNAYLGGLASLGSDPE